VPSISLALNSTRSSRGRSAGRRSGREIVVVRFVDFFRWGSPGGCLLGSRTRIANPIDQWHFLDETDAAGRELKSIRGGLPFWSESEELLVNVLLATCRLVADRSSFSKDTWCPVIIQAFLNSDALDILVMIHDIHPLVILITGYSRINCPFLHNSQSDVCKLIILLFLQWDIMEALPQRSRAASLHSWMK